MGLIKMVIFFDIGSTLIDGKANPVRHLVKELKLPESAKSTISDFLFSTQIEQPKEVVKFLHQRFNVANDLASPLVTDLWEAQFRDAVAIPGAIETIRRFEAIGITIGYISNIWLPFYRGFKREFPDKSLKHQSFLSFRMGVSKPDTAIYKAALNAVNESPENAIMVGDTYTNDIEPAMAIGMKTIWVLHRPEREKKDLVRVLNHNASKPYLTLGQIGELQPKQISIKP